MTPLELTHQPCLKIVVSGRVQGVYFRANTQKQAQKLGLTGYAKNLPDGAVEIVACGELQAIEQLVAWCHKGPWLAKVNKVETQPITPTTTWTKFSIG